MSTGASHAGPAATVVVRPSARPNTPKGGQLSHERDERSREEPAGRYAGRAKRRLGFPDPPRACEWVVRKPESGGLIPVVVWLVGAGHVHADVVGLVLGEDRQLSA